MSSNNLSLDFGLSNTHVLITGGNGAIGSVTVQLFLLAGCKVTIFDLKPSSDSALESNPNVQYIKVDISSESQVFEGFQKAYEKFGLVQICVCLASKDLSYLPHWDNFDQFSTQQWKSTFDTNVHGTFFTVKSYMSQLKSHIKKNPDGAIQNLSVIVIGSESGEFGETQNPDYSAGKSSVMYGLVHSVRKPLVQLHPSARINIVSPGPVDTQMFRKECAANPDQYYEDCVATTTLKRPVRIEGVAKAILFLASEKWAGDITGQRLNVDSGKFGKLLWSKDEFHQDKAKL